MPLEISARLLRDSDDFLVQQMIGEKKARKVEELAIKLYSKVITQIYTPYFP